MENRTYIFLLGQIFNEAFLKTGSERFQNIRFISHLGNSFKNIFKIVIITINNNSYTYYFHGL